MKIKMKKKMRLDELIKHIYNNNESNRIFINEKEDFAVHTNFASAVSLESMGEDIKRKCIHESDVFAVEVEKEVTKRTRFDELFEVYYDEQDQECRSIRWDDSSVEEVLDGNNTDQKAVAIFFKDKLLWTEKDGLLEGEE